MEPRTTGESAALQGEDVPTGSDSETPSQSPSEEEITALHQSAKALADDSTATPAAKLGAIRQISLIGDPEDSELQALADRLSQQAVDGIVKDAKALLTDPTATAQQKVVAARQLEIMGADDEDADGNTVSGRLGKQVADEMLTRAEALLTDTTATIQQKLSASRQLQIMGLEDEDGDEDSVSGRLWKQVTDELQTKAEAVLGDPRATPVDLLSAARQVELLGLGGKEDGTNPLADALSRRALDIAGATNSGAGLPQQPMDLVGGAQGTLPTDTTGTWTPPGGFDGAADARGPAAAGLPRPGIEGAGTVRASEALTHPGIDIVPDEPRDFAGLQRNDRLTGHDDPTNRFDMGGGQQNDDLPSHDDPTNRFDMGGGQQNDDLPSHDDPGGDSSDMGGGQQNDDLPSHDDPGGDSSDMGGGQQNDDLPSHDDPPARQPAGVPNPHGTGGDTTQEEQGSGVDPYGNFTYGTHSDGTTRVEYEDGRVVHLSPSGEKVYDSADSDGEDESASTETGASSTEGSTDGDEGNDEDEDDEDDDDEDDEETDTALTTGDEGGGYTGHVPMPVDGTDTGPARDQNSPYVHVAPTNPGGSSGYTAGPPRDPGDTDPIALYTEDQGGQPALAAGGSGSGGGTRPGTAGPETGPYDSGSGFMAGPPRNPGDTDPIASSSDPLTGSWAGSDGSGSAFGAPGGGGIGSMADDAPAPDGSGGDPSPSPGPGSGTEPALKMDGMAVIDMTTGQVIRNPEIPEKPTESETKVAGGSTEPALKMDGMAVIDMTTGQVIRNPEIPEIPEKPTAAETKVASPDPLGISAVSPPASVASDPPTPAADPATREPTPEAEVGGRSARALEAAKPVVSHEDIETSKEPTLVPDDAEPKPPEEEATVVIDEVAADDG